MKKFFLIFLLLITIGCTSTTKITKTNVVKESDELLAKVEKVENNKVFLELENKTNDILEIKLSESTINNKKVLDVDKMNTNDLESMSNSLKNISNNMDNTANMNNPFYKRKPINTSAKNKVAEEAEDLLLNPNERTVANIGTRNGIFPMKIIIKYIRNDKTDFVSLQVEDTGIEITN